MLLICLNHYAVRAEQEEGRRENYLSCERFVFYYCYCKTASQNDNMTLSGIIYFIHFSTIHQRNEIRAMKHFISLILLRNRNTLWGISKNTELLHSCTVGTCEFFLAAVTYALLQIFKLMFHLLILPLGLLTLSPEQKNTTHVS